MLNMKMRCQPHFSKVHLCLAVPRLSMLALFDVIMWFGFTYATFGIIT